MELIKTDILVIGAGSGGLSVAAGASQMGANVVLLEGHKMGGDCLNYGCVPSKALLAAAKRAHSVVGKQNFGVTSSLDNVDYAGAMQHVQAVIKKIEPVDSQERFEGFGVRVIREFGAFVSPDEVEAGPFRIRARRIVIATGSCPFIPQISGLSEVPYLTNETLFDLREKPRRLLIIGGGPIGMEMAQAHRRLGCEVVVFEAAKALGKDDPEMVALVLDRLRREGVDVRENTVVSSVVKNGTGIHLTTEDGSSCEGSHLLLAVGRRSNTEKLNLSAAGVESTKQGIKVDQSLRTTNRRVYAIGDVTGGLQFTHAAGYQAGVIIRSLLFSLSAKAKTDHVPWATYTDPELAQIGLTEAQARDRYGRKLEVARFDFHHNDRAIAEGVTEGLIKVMVVRGRPVGVSIVGHQAGELISLWSLVIANRLKMAEVAAMISPYPSIGEINKRAAGAYFSPRLFDNPTVKRVVRLIQRWIP